MTENEMIARLHENRKLGIIEEIPDWDWPEGDIDKFFDSLENKKVQKSEDIDIEKAKDKIKGGKADNLTIQDIADKHKVSVEDIKKQLQMGVKVEMEHTDDPKKAVEIARDHLEEFPDYYTRLAKMENEAKKENKKD